MPCGMNDGNKASEQQNSGAAKARDKASLGTTLRHENDAGLASRKAQMTWAGLASQTERARVRVDKKTKLRSAKGA